MNNISTVKNCANCGSCVNICPRSAIRIGEEKQFYYPAVVEKKCTNCGLCLEHCPVNHIPGATVPVAAFGGWSHDDQLVLNSSSGGAFGALAEKVIGEGGVVFGCAFTKDHRSVALRSSDEAQLRELRKSKYVESLPSNAFSSAKSALDDGRKVMFCAAPCQIAGLKAFLGKEYDGLLTCDFACGGFPSHALYREYIEGLEKKYHSEVISVDFRPKTHGWERHAILVRFKNGKQYNRLGTEDDWFRAFLYGKLTVRENCLSCPFSDHHAADITLADYWKYRSCSDLKNDDGISLILCNNEKGLESVRAVQKQMFLTEQQTEQAAYNNRPTSVSQEERKRRDAFLLSCREHGFAYACKKHLPLSGKQKIKERAARLLYRKG